MTILSLLTSLSLLVALAAECAAHSELSCVDWDGTGDCHADSARNGYGWPSHPNYPKDGTDYNYERRYAGPLCVPYVNNGTTLGAPASPKPAPAVAGEKKTVVWSCNRHCQKFKPGDGANTNAFLWHSPDDNPDRSLYETTPLVQFNWNNCWDNTYGISAHASSHEEMLCSGTFTVPDNLKTGIHTFVWSWLWNGKWDLMAEDIVYLSCFQYDVKGIGGSYPASNKTPPSVGFTANLTNYMQAPSNLTNSGANGIVYPTLGDKLPAGASKTATPTKSITKVSSSKSTTSKSSKTASITSSKASVSPASFTKSALPVAIAKPTLTTSAKVSLKPTPTIPKATTTSRKPTGTGSSGKISAVTASSISKATVSTSAKKSHWYKSYWRKHQHLKHQS